MGILNFNNLGKEKKPTEESVEYKYLLAQQKLMEQQQRYLQQIEEAQRMLEAQRKLETKQRLEAQRRLEEQQRLEAQRKLEEQQRLEAQRKLEEQQRLEAQKEFEQQRLEAEERKKREFQALIREQENLWKEEVKENVPTVPGEKQNKLKKIEARTDSRKLLQQELSECSKSLRDMQRIIKETYQFEPCRQLCELLINIRQNVYQSIDDIQEDLEYVIEAFGINELVPVAGEVFDAKYHTQVYSEMKDARGKEIEKVHAVGFELDGEIIVKAQVSIK